MENELSTSLFSESDLIRQEMKHIPTIIVSKWSEWSSYSQCEKNCKKLSRIRMSSKQQLSYSKFKGLKVSTRSCKIPSSNLYSNSIQYRARCIGPTHRYKECYNLKVRYAIRVCTFDGFKL